MTGPNSMNGREEEGERQTFNLTLYFIPGRGLVLKNGGWPLYQWAEGILDKSDRESCLKACREWINANNPDNSTVNLNVVDL